MCLLVAEIIMLVGGLYGLITGKMKLTKNMQLEGWRARVAGLFLAAPLPLAFIAGILVGLLFGMDASVQGMASIIELLLVLGGLGGAVIFAWLSKPKEHTSTDEDLSQAQP